MCSMRSGYESLLTFMSFKGTKCMYRYLALFFSEFNLKYSMNCSLSTSISWSMF